MLRDYLSFHAVPTELGVVQSTVVAAARDLGCDDALLLKLELVLEELFLNSACYGTVSASSPTVRVKLSAGPKNLTMTYEDNGLPYDSFAAADRSVLTEAGANRRVGGLGVILIEGLAATAEYSRQGEWNRIELVFQVESKSSESRF